MRVPFFSKKDKEVLKKNEERVFLLSQEDQEKILNNPKIEINKKLLQLLKENNELKVLYDELQHEFSKDLKSGGTYLLSISENEVEFITNPEVLPNNKIKISRKRTIDIKKNAFVGKLKSLGRMRQFRIFFMEKEGEYTFDPRDKTPIEIKRQNELQLSLGHVTAESGIVESIVQGLGSKIKKWWESLGSLIVLGAIVFMFLFFLGQYDLIKPVAQP